MVFSSPLFLFLFLPLVLFAYFAVRGVTLRNIVLLIFSLVFYTWGEGDYIALLLTSIVGNHYAALWIGRLDGTARSRACALVVSLNLALLVYYKYMVFFVANLSELLVSFSLPALPLPEIRLPLGISFFTFHAISYVVDVYRTRILPQPRLYKTALYMSLFPQLVAGPVVRYTDVAAEIETRRSTLEGAAAGTLRFSIGLFKKVCLANPLGEFVDFAYGLPAGEVSASLAWLAALAYLFQIYFDFSGYSDMAIGLGALFGFKFPENFLHPYASRSVTEFWRRWHVTLSSWFRDYLYIPLGGSRGGEGSTYRNLLIVFVLCGLWHGASWTFLVWGLYHGGFLVAERLVGLPRIERLPSFVRLLYVITVVMVGWVFFRADTFQQAFVMLGAMTGFGPSVDFDPRILMYFTNETCVVLIAAGACSLPWLQFVRRAPSWFPYARPAIVALLLVLCSAKLAIGSYNPFIYFRF